MNLIKFIIVGDYSDMLRIIEKDRIMKKITLLLFLFATVVSAQDMTFKSGGSLSIESGAFLYLNGLELQPSVNYQFDGPNNITTVETPLSDPISIKKVMEFSNPMVNYVGKVSFNYQNSDLNNLDESDLELIFKNTDMDWVDVNSKLNLDVKTIDHTFNNPVNIYGFTAIEKQTLGIANFDQKTLQVYPNPTTSLLQVNFNNEVEFEVYNLLGSSLIKKTGKSIDLSNLSAGTYLVKVSNLQNDSSVYKKIIKR